MTLIKRKRKKIQRKKKKHDDNDNDNSKNSIWLDILFHILFRSGNDQADHKTPKIVKKPSAYPYGLSNGFPMGSNKFRNYGFIAEGAYFYHDAGTTGIHGFLLNGDYRTHRFAANANIHALYEGLDNDEASLTFFGLNTGYEIIHTPNIILRPYLGLRNLDGEGIDFWGLEGGVRLLMLPQKPLNINLDVALSQLNGKPLTIFYGSLGIMIKRIELRLGIQVFRSEWTTLEGLRTGVRFWF